MSELPPTRVPRPSRRMILALACSLPFWGLCGGASADNVPAGLRACAAESDPGQRLDCYDREMKRLMAPAARPAEPASAAAAGPVPGGAEAAPSPAMRAPEAPVATAARANATEKPTAPRRSSLWTIFTGGGHVTARIVRLDRSPDSLVLYLDNGQVWRQTGRASGELSLRKGDKVTIAKQMGSYWLSSRYVADMRVRPQSR
jgi:hypothetical protein